MTAITTTTLDTADNNFVLGETLRPLLTHAMGSAVEVFDTSGPAAGPPPHRHPWEETYVVLSGQLEVTVDGSAQIVGPGGNAAHRTKTVTVLPSWLAKSNIDTWRARQDSNPRPAA